MTEKQWTIFLSYADEDRAFADWLYKKLLDSNLSVWYEKVEILIGDSETEMRGAGLRGSEFLVVVISQNAVNSGWVKAELDVRLKQQIDEWKIEVLPVVLDKTSIEDISPYFKGKKALRFPKEGSDEVFEDLLYSIEGHLKRGSSSRPPVIDGSKPGDVPPPYASLETLSLPTSLYAFPLDNEDGIPLPFDLGMVWGLSRGSFLGLIAAPALETDLVYTHLVQTERTLYEAVREARLKGKNIATLPYRWWIKVNVDRFIYGPASAQDVWEAAIDRQNELVRYLTLYGFPANTIPGVFIRMNVLESDNSLLDKVVNWCYRLIRDVFPTEQLAIIVQISGEDEKRVYRFVDDLKTRLSWAEGEQVPVEAMSLNYLKYIQHVNEVQPLAKVDEDNLFPGETASGYRGICFHKWVKEAAPKGKARLSKEEANNYSQVIAEYRRIDQMLQNSIREECEDWFAERVVDDLDQLASDSTAGLDSQFLHFIKNYNPKRVYSLIKAYACSNRPEARRTALVLAANSEAPDILLDAWVEGSELQLSRFPMDHLAPLSNEKSFVDNLALAVLRQHQRGLKREAAQEIIEKLLPLLNLDLCDVCNLCIGKISEERFFSTYSEDRISFLVRAEAHFIIRIKSLEPYLEIENPDPWWLLMAELPNFDRISELLSLDVGRRAVLSLCSAQEWRRLPRDPVIDSKTTSCRRNRVVSYRS